jgi:hypothetical protein
MDIDLTKKVLAALEEYKVDYVVFGGVALNLHGIPRATEDLDIFIAPNESNIARLRDALRKVFNDNSTDEITASDLLGDFPAIQYVPPTGDFHIDILTRLGEMYSYSNLEFERINLEGISVPVVTALMLYRMKKSTVRPKDWGDAIGASLWI